MVVALTKRGGRVSACCLALSLLVFLPEAASPLTPAGTVASHSFTAKFRNPSEVREARSNQTKVTVKDLADPGLVPPRNAVVLAGASTDFLHTITNRGNTADSFKLKAALLQGAASAKSSAVPRMLFYAADGKTLLPTDASGLQVIGPIAPGGSLGLVLRVTPPAGSEGSVHDVVLTATSRQFPSRTSNLTDQMVVPAPGLTPPVKSVTPAGSVLPGTVLTYSLTLTNGADVAVTGVRVTDMLDPLLEYEQGSATVPSGLGGGASYDAGARTVRFTITTLPAGFSGTVTFKARVRSDAPASAQIVNTADISSEVSANPLSSNSTVTTVQAATGTPTLVVSKVAGSSTAEVGDTVLYTVRVENPGPSPLSHVTVFDKLPTGFRYLKGTSTVNGVSVPDPVGAGVHVTWDLGTMAAGEVKMLSYRCAISGDAQTGNNVNWATTTGTTPTGGSVVSQSASASVKLRSSILGDKAIILGRLFVDGNQNGVPDSGEPGVPAVRVYLEDGSYVFTDREGQYSFTGLAAGNHVVKIDRATLPSRLVPLPFNTAFAGVGWSQFVTVPFGGPARGDFALITSPGAAAPVPGAPPAPDSTAPLMPPAPQAPQPPLGDGPPTQLRVTPERLDMPADGKTVVPFTVQLLNAEGKRVSGMRTVTVMLGKGEITEADADPALPGHQVRVKDGVGVFQLRAGSGPGKGDIAVTGDNGTKGKVDLFFSNDLRDWILVGLGSLTVGHRSVSGNIENLDKEDRFDEGIFHDERLAFFTRGRILGKYLLTAAYDSKKETPDGVFQVIDPEKYYPVYGDASDIGYEAQSRGKIYVKIEAGRSYLLAGDYRTDLSENEFSRYDRALNGVKVEADNGWITAKGFESRTDEMVTMDQIRGNGTSGYYTLSRKPVFQNSERVRIEVRDRYHSERIISVSEKLRYVDYTIDYNAGTILFKEPVPSLDQNLNPVTIVVNYQSQDGTTERYVYGGRALLKSEGGSYLGGTAVVEEGAVQNNTLFGADAGIKLGERMSLKGEGAVSDTIERGKGKAWKVELSSNPFDSVNVGGYYRRVDADFFNPSMTANTEYGTEKYGGRLDYRGLSDTLIFGESFVQKDLITGNRQFGNQAGVIRKFSLFEGEAGFKRIEEDKGGSDDASNILYAGVKGAVTSRLDATLRRDQLLAPSDVAEYQSRTFLKLEYRLTDKTRAFVTEEYQEGSPSMRQATRFGLESRLSEKMRLVTGYQLSRGSEGASEQSSVEVNTKILDRDDLTLESRSGYQIDHALSQERGQAILGLNSRYRAAEGLFLNTSFERIETVEGSGGTRTAFTLAGEYLRQKDLKLTGRYEIRNGPEATAMLYNAGLAYKLSRSLTLLGKATYWDNDADAGADHTLDSYIGTALRPLSDNPLQLLTLARYRIEEKGSVPGFGENRSLVLSAEPTYRLVKDLSLQGKYAGKFYWLDSFGRSSQTYTDLILAGISYDLAQKWELAVYMKLANQYDTGQHSLGTVASAGYRIYRNVVVSAGYNYARLDDRDLTGESYQGQGPFVGVKVKFDEEMFETSDRRVIPIAVPPPAPPAASEMPAMVPLPPPKPPAIPALFVAAVRVDDPLKLSGSAELLTLLVNGEHARLPSTAVTVTRERLDGSIELDKGKLRAPLDFTTSVEKPELVRSWTLYILNAEGKVVRSVKGSGAPQERFSWRGDTEEGTLKAGDIYQYQLQVTYRDGSTFSTGRELFGVNRREAVLLTLAGGAFIFDSSRLTPEAKRLLKGAARVLRAHPEEKVIIEGHTDGIGTVQYNIGLSKRRCNSAADYLVREEGIPASRLVRRWFGKSRPIADNATADGRRKNRRVELKGDFQDKVPVSPDDRYRSRPFVVINDRNIPLDALGRFETSVPAQTQRLKVEMGDSTGRALATTLAVPGLTVTGPAGEQTVQFGKEAGGVKVEEDGTGRCTLSGAIDAGARLEVEGKEVVANGKGEFAVELPLASGERVFGMVLRNGDGCSKLMNLRVKSTRQEPAEDRPEP